ncbi:YdcF family protein [Actinopolymorpha pittospori]
MGTAEDAPRQCNRRRHILPLWARLALVAMLMVGLEGILFVLPPTDDPAPVDAIVVFDGPGDRIARAWELADMGYAPNVVVSIDDTSKCTPERPTVLQLCVSPDPATTRGEARAFTDLARKHGWTHLIAVSSTSQSVRARLRLGRCFDGDVRYVAVRESFFDQLYRIVYENGALPKALFIQRDC